MRPPALFRWILLAACVAQTAAASHLVLPVDKAPSLALDTLTPGRVTGFTKYLEGFQKEKGARPFRVATVRGDAILVAGPWESVRDIRAALKELAAQAGKDAWSGAFLPENFDASCRSRSRTHGVWGCRFLAHRSASSTTDDVFASVASQDANTYASMPPANCSTCCSVGVD
ncbi:MAG: hypothetical protein FJW40_16655 [Acidobacteria bacterium]|nr:hypothetical protein [Acidobacteriota bacterium]